MSLVSSSPQQQPPQGICTSTLVYSEKKDFSTAVVSDDSYCEEHWNALVSAVSQHASHQNIPLARAQELDLIEAASSVELYDKMLLLVRHGDTCAEEAQGDGVVDPRLSGKGVGQVLNLSRRAATFCNEETGLVPELVVTSPLKRAMQTALFIFPQYSPAACLKEVPWICHGGLVEQPSHAHDVPSTRQELEKFFPGMDFSLYDQYANDKLNTATTMSGMVESKLDLLDRTDTFLQWIRDREERVIVVSSHSTWLQSFCGCSLHYEPEESGSEMFQTGEMRAVGIKFD